MVLGEGVAIPNIGILDAVEQHVHAADAKHRVVEVEPVEHLVVEVRPWFLIPEHLGVVMAQVLASCDQEAGSAAGRVADDIGRGGRDHLHHELDDVARRPELAVLSCGRDLGEHVFIEVALGVAILHRDLGDEIHYFRKKLRRGDRESRVLHVVCVRRTVAPERPQKWENVLDQRP